MVGLIDLLFKNSPIGKWCNHRNIYLLGILTILSGLGWSNVLMSIGQFILLGNFLLELDFKRKLNEINLQPIIILLVSVFLIHIIGFIWSENLSYAIKDSTIKIPLIILPIIIGTSKPLNKLEWKLILSIHLIILFILTLFSLGKLLHWYGEIIVDKRELSINISHIRYGLLLGFTSILSFFYLQLFRSWERYVVALIASWFLLCLFLFELSTGIVCTGAALLIISVLYIQKRKTLSFKLISYAGLVLILGLFIHQVSEVKNGFYQKVNLDYEQDSFNTSSVNGEVYWNMPDSKLQENGVYLWRFIALKEIEKEWEKRSDLNFSGLDKKGNKLEFTLYRFMSSKGLKKDSLGFSKLSDHEIRAIENGVPNIYLTQHNPIQNRIHKIFYEYDNYTKYGIANGFSMAMRLEYWKNTWELVQKHPWFGVGTGDIDDEIMKQYELNQTTLEKQFQKRAHNQYLTIWASLGIFGFLIFLASLVLPPFYLLKELRLLYFAFLVIFSLSFFTEDTLETQAGVTLFAILNSLILFALPRLEK